MEANGLREQVRSLDVEVARLRDRSHEHGNIITGTRGQVEALRDDVQELKESQKEDNRRLEGKIDRLSGEFSGSRMGMTRAEKIALGGLGATVVMAILAAAALIQGAPG